MGNIFIFSILMGLASALVLFPFTKKKLQLAQEKIQIGHYFDKG